jgi:hypothetical protein
MQARLRSLEQFMPSATAGELIAARRQPVDSIPPDATAHAALHTTNATYEIRNPWLYGGVPQGVRARPGRGRTMSRPRSVALAALVFLTAWLRFMAGLVAWSPG